VAGAVDTTSRRPPVSVVVPFGGDSADAAALLCALRALHLGPDDELIVADNGLEATDWGALAGSQGPNETPIRAVRAGAERSSYYARNVGAEAAASEWILFIDSDCEPSASLIDDYFADPVGARTGIVAGRVAAAEQAGLIPAYAKSRGHISEEFHLETGPFPAGVTANLLVRRATWDNLGGFFEGVRSGADVEFCWRAQAAGWGFEHAPQAEVRHRHPDRLRPMLRKTMRHAAGRLWVNRRWGHAFGRPRLLRPLVRSGGGALIWLLRGKPKLALFKILDGAWACANVSGYFLGSNRADAMAPSGTSSPPPTGAGGLRLLLLTDAFPARSETFVHNEAIALAELGWHVRVESSARPLRPERIIARRLRPRYMEDDRLTEKLGSLLWLAARHPLRCVWDLRQARRWRAEEPAWHLASIAPFVRRLARSKEQHIHVHFAAGAALHGLRAARFLGIGYSLAPHAYDIFQHPRNLTEKLERAEFVVTDSDYNVEYLRQRVARRHRRKIQRQVLGVDGGFFRRTRPHPDAGVVVAVGRLIEKKGFSDLIAAAATLRDGGMLKRVVICGEGPLRDELLAQIEASGLNGVVTIVAGWGPGPVRELLEQADLFAMPCVVAEDGDRDGAPVVIKEALAMELPVVGTDEVGVPEMVDDRWGRLAPPRDPAALAAAIEELLALPGAKRAEMGAEGRRFVLEHGDIRRETRRLSSLLERAIAAE
jgi:glycosyltransferase involved in cell wall biosynthesis